MLAEVLATLYRASRSSQRFCIATVGLGLGVLCLFAAWNMISMLISSYEQLQDRRTYLGNLQLVIAAAKAASASPDMTASVNADFFSGSNREVVSAEIQAWLGNAVAESGAQLQSVESLSPGTRDQEDSVALAANVTGSWKSVQNIVFRVETSRPLLFVQSVDIQANSYGDDAIEPQVLMRMVLAGTFKSAVRKDGT